MPPLSYLVADCPQIKELDVNPLPAAPEEVIALDARVVVDRSLVMHSVALSSEILARKSGGLKLPKSGRLW